LYNVLQIISSLGNNHIGRESFYGWQMDSALLKFHLSKNLTTNSNRFNFFKNAPNLGDHHDTIYHLKVRLTKALPLTPDCGYFEFALVQKFEIISADIPNYDNKFILLIQPCPEFLGKHFFKKNNIYDVEASKTWREAKNFIYANRYKKQKLLILWTKTIKKTN
jgi:hypothetical protein